MEKKNYIEYWVKTAEEDLISMERVFVVGRYDWALFIGHLALEKILKAAWVKNNEENIPTKTHNLLKISEEAKLELTEEQILFLNRVTNFNLETRYPDYKLDFLRVEQKNSLKKILKKLKTYTNV